MVEEQIRIGTAIWHCKGLLQDLPLHVITYLSWVLTRNGEWIPSCTWYKRQTKKNGTRTVFEGGEAFISAPEVRTAVTTVCGVRRVKKGTVTILLDKVYDTNCENAALRRETKRLEGIEEQKRKDATKGVKFNTAMTESLAPDKELLETHMEMLGNAKGVCVVYLQGQYRARKMRAEQDDYTWPRIGLQFRSKVTKMLKMTPNDKSDTKAYLKTLVLNMMDADSKRDRPVNAADMAISGLLQTVPTLSHLSLNPVAVSAKSALDQSMIAAATQGDDPWLLFLEKEYLLQLCFLSDIAARHKLYRVAQISYWPSTKQHYANWEATLEPVHLDPLGGLYVADEDVIVGPGGIRLTKSESFLGYIVVQYIDGDEEDPVRTQCVDLYIEDALPKHLAYLHRQKKVTPLLCIISSVLSTLTLLSPLCCDQDSPPLKD